MENINERGRQRERNPSVNRVQDIKGRMNNGHQVS